VTKHYYDVTLFYVYVVCNCTVFLYNIRAISDLCLSDVNTLFEQRCQKCKASHQYNSLPNFIKQVVSARLFKRAVNSANSTKFYRLITSYNTLLHFAVLSVLLSACLLLNVLLMCCRIWLCIFFCCLFLSVYSEFKGCAGTSGLRFLLINMLLLPCTSCSKEYTSLFITRLENNSVVLKLYSSFFCHVAAGTGFPQVYFHF